VPHCIIEYSKTLASKIEPGELINVVHRAALESGLFEASHIRTRASGYEDHVIGYPVNDFIHVTLKILSGRNEQQKKQLTGLVLGELEKIGLTSISLTVEVVDIERETYARNIIRG
jgi:5-carboxymethyl-2-hydroxymuconate isomerase